MDRQREVNVMASEYVSAELVEPATPGSKPMIKAIGDDGVEYWVPSDNPLTYDVPPWPAFIESAAGKAFLDKMPPDPPEAA